MNYIGSKNKLSSFIIDTIKSVVGENLSEKIFCDLFAGTGIVGRNLKPEVKSVISNDIELYSFVLNKNYIGNHRQLEYQDLISELNNLTGFKGFISEEYSENGKGQRLYFSEYNGRKIDAARQQIESWQSKNNISDNQYYFLLCSLLESADKVANTASVYGAFLKQIKKSAQKNIVIEPALFSINCNEHKVFNEDANQLINKISGDILYLDPPYNARQYGANYHLLNTIASYKPFNPKGKTGLPKYSKSKYCSPSFVQTEFESLIKYAKFKHIFLSYNNEGLMNINDIKRIMEKYGKYNLREIEYQRFKADRSENRSYTTNKTTEYLHILEKVSF